MAPLEVFGFNGRRIEAALNISCHVFPPDTEGCSMNQSASFEDAHVGSVSTYINENHSTLSRIIGQEEFTLSQGGL